MERFYTFTISINNNNIKYQPKKLFFVLNLLLKLVRTTFANNADIGSLKSLHTFLKNCLYLMLVKFEQNHVVQTTTKFELFDKKKTVLIHFWQNFDAIWASFL